eukprot:TRINITY_DN1273_c0_g1_i2.p1 TRINITY_DN1273_c0_g1~~TRINITY_DN1273_c0_g1_i2.p1  ORF type:complete len:492 (+),score=95.00 TRINITY_DN1273_c0_g1_i2:84-1478(+)
MAVVAAAVNACCRRRASDTAKESFTFKLEPAPSKGFKYAKCRACEENIVKSQLRFGSAPGGGTMSWWHLDCITSEQVEAAATDVDRVVCPEEFKNQLAEAFERAKTEPSKKKARVSPPANEGGGGNLTTYTVESTPGKGFRWARCSTCNQDITKGELRFGTAQGSSYTSWCHLKCLPPTRAKEVDARGVESVKGQEEHGDELRKAISKAMVNVDGDGEIDPSDDDAPLILRRKSETSTATVVATMSGMTTYKVETTPRRGFKWAKCKACGCDIVLGQLRLGVSSGGAWAAWSHLSCITSEQAREIVALPQGVEDVDGFAEHRAELEGALAKVNDGVSDEVDPSRQDSLSMLRQKSETSTGTSAAATTSAVTTYIVETTPRKGFRWAKCRTCGCDIVQGQLRLGISAGGSWTAWSHLACITSGQAREIIASPQGVEGVGGYEEHATELRVALADVNEEVSYEAVP